MKTAILIVITVALTIGAVEGIPRIRTAVAEKKQRDAKELEQSLTGSWADLKILWDTIDCDNRRESVLQAFLDDDEIEKTPLSPIARDYFVNSTYSLGSDARVSSLLVPFEVDFIKLKEQR